MTIHCQCGEVMGEYCPWEGDLSDTVLVDVIPEHLRASHRAANNSGRYPANGAERLRISKECAADVLESEGEWAELVENSAEVRGSNG